MNTQNNNNKIRLTMIKKSYKEMCEGKTTTTSHQKLYCILVLWCKNSTVSTHKVLKKLTQVSHLSFDENQVKHVQS